MVCLFYLFFVCIHLQLLSFQRQLWLSRRFWAQGDVRENISIDFLDVASLFLCFGVGRMSRWHVRVMPPNWCNLQSTTGNISRPWSVQWYRQRIISLYVQRMTSPQDASSWWWSVIPPETNSDDICWCNTSQTTISQKMISSHAPDDDIASNDVSDNANNDISDAISRGCNLQKIQSSVKYGMMTYPDDQMMKSLQPRSRKDPWICFGLVNHQTCCLGIVSSWVASSHCIFWRLHPLVITWGYHLVTCHHLAWTFSRKILSFSEIVSGFTRQNSCASMPLTAEEAETHRSTQTRWVFPKNRLYPAGMEI